MAPGKKDKTKSVSTPTTSKSSKNSKNKGTPKDAPKVSPTKSVSDKQDDTSKAKPVKCKKCDKVCLSEEFHQTIEDDSIDCDICGFWFHKPCTNTTTEEWEMLQNGNKNITYKCCDCLENKAIQDERQTELFGNLLVKNNERLFSHFDAIEARILQKVDMKIEEKIKDCDQKNKATNDAVLKKIDSMEVNILQIVDQKIEEKLKSFEEKNNTEIDEKISQKVTAETLIKEEQIVIENKIQVQVSQSFDELKDREERKNKLIFFNISESTKTDKDEAATEDLQKIKEVLTHTNPDLKEKTIKDLSIENLKRLGNIPTNPTEASKPRPVRVTLPDVKTKFKILNKSSLLKTFRAQENIGIKPDLTKQQQKEDQELRKEVKRRKDEGEDVMIFRNKVIKREDHARLKAELASSSSGSSATPNPNQQ